MSAVYVNESAALADDLNWQFLVAWTDTGDGLEDAREAATEPDGCGGYWPVEPAFGDLNDDSLGMYCMGQEL